MLSQGIWARVAAAIAPHVSPEQLARLRAAHGVYAAAMQRLNEQRAALTAQAVAFQRGGAAAVAAVPPLSLSGEPLLEQLHLADAIELNMMRTRTAAIVHGWSMLRALGPTAAAALCVAAWPMFPLLRAVVAHLLLAEAALTGGAAELTVAA
jgi:hypothetical protein